MKEAIRCCISCILPCGALDVIRIVHSTGRVEEISGSVSAGEIMQLYPKHVLRKPPSASPPDGSDRVPKAVILPPNAELQRGKIYFLMPISKLPEKARPPAAAATRRRNSKKNKEADSNAAPAGAATDKTRLLLNERYLSEILSENQRGRRRGRVGVWRPHLESISEVSSDL